MNDYEIKKLYEDMEMHLIKSMKRNLGRHLTEENEVGFKFSQWQAEKLKELKRYQRENKKIVGRYILGLDEEVSEHLQNELKQGSINAIKQYNKILGDNLKPSKIMNKSFFRTNDRKVNNLIKVVNNDLKTANTSALRMANDQYRQIIHKSAFFVGNGVFTEKQAAAMAVDEISEKKLTTLAVDEASKNFLAGGLNCIEYSDGRRVNIASYSQMAIRTASLRSQLMGEGDFRASIGRTLVKVTTHGGACPLCTKWQGKVLIDDVYSGGKPDGKHTLLSQAMAQGFLHPNCRHGITTYYPELEEDDEDIEPVNEEQEETQQQLNYAVRNVKKYKRLEKGSLAKENIERYSLKRKQWTGEAKLLEEQKEEKVIAMIKYIDNDLKGVDVRLLEENKKQLESLTNKFPKMKRYTSENEFILGGFTDYSDTIAKTNSSTMTGAKSQYISLNKYHYKDYGSFIKMEKHNIVSNSSMPCDDKYVSVYTLTHEYGHAIHNVLIKEYAEMHHEEYQNMKEKVLKASLSRGKQILKDYEIKIVKGYVDEIKGIALTKDAEVTFSKYLSDYGKTNYLEAFAEIFANSQCGKPNVLGEAMNEWLEKRMK